MPELIYWGEGGKYGPYTAQEDGWPHAGEVMRDYRQKMGISAEDAAKLYSEALERQRSPKQGSKRAKPITASWILNMENENRVPTDIARRRLLADLFNIPYALFGLTTLEQIVFSPKIELQTQTSSPVAPALVQDVSKDIAHYEKEIHLFWQLHYTSTAHHVLDDIDAAILSLESLEQMSSGHFQKHLQALLNSYYQLGTEITRDQAAFAKSYFYANHAVRVTKRLGQEHMIATARYRRGYTSLTWGAYGEADSTGAFILNKEKINNAIRDFEQALPHALPQLQGYIKLELSRAYGYLKRSPIDISIALSLVKEARDAVERGTFDDPYTPMSSLNEGMYLLGSALTYTAVDRPGKAIEQLEKVEKLKNEKGIGRKQIRRQAWVDILYARAALEDGELYEATRRATNAFHVCKDIHSVCNIAIINDLYSRLPKDKSFYKNFRDAQNLGTMLAKHYQSLGGDK